MGKATRWFKGLLGIKKEKENIDSSNVAPINQKEKKRWSFGKSGKATNAVGNVPISNLSPNMPTVDTAWLRSYLTESDKKQSKHAIAVAAATAAAAEAAVAAAQAAVAVVRLTSQGKGDGMLYGNRDKWAVVKIQNVFRGYLARKALRALKGLVKLQALVRGYLVRKRAAATLHSMQALIRAQAAARFQRARCSFKKDNCLYPEFHARKSIERLDKTRSEYHSKRLSATYEAFEESPKIVEVDTFKQRTRSRRRRFSTALSECSEDMPYHTISSPLPCPGPGQISVQDCRHIQDFEWYFDAQETKFATAQNTPKFGSSLWSNVPGTAAKSVCGDSSFYRPYSNFPNYMANTKSFKAKLRSQSAPKQRPEPAGSKKRLSLDEIMAARNSVSSVRMQRVCPQGIEEVYRY